MAECECGGPDWVLICPKGCGCICWEGEDGVDECISYCEGEELPSPPHANVEGATGGLGAIVVKDGKKGQFPQITLEQEVRMSMDDLPLVVLAQAVSKLVGVEVWAPVLSGGTRLSTTREGRVADVCERLGLRFDDYCPTETE